MNKSLPITAVLLILLVSNQIVCWPLAVKNELKKPINAIAEYTGNRATNIEISPGFTIKIETKQKADMELQRVTVKDPFNPHNNLTLYPVKDRDGNEVRSLTLKSVKGNTIVEKK